MIDKVKDLEQKLAMDYPAVDVAVKGGGSLGATFGAMSINDIAGLIVAFLTGIYMLFQIEAAWRRRKREIEKE